MTPESLCNWRRHREGTSSPSPRRLLGTHPRLRTGRSSGTGPETRHRTGPGRREARVPESPGLFTLKYNAVDGVLVCLRERGQIDSFGNKLKRKRSFGGHLSGSGVFDTGGVEESRLSLVEGQGSGRSFRRGVGRVRSAETRKSKETQGETCLPF